MKDGSEIFNLKPPLRRGPFCPILRAKVPGGGAAVTGPGL